MAGNIKIVEPQDNYKRVSRGIILRKDIDPFTLGVYVKMLTLGEKWKLSVSGLASYLGITDYKVRQAFSKIIDAGYMKRTASKDESGKFNGWDFEVFSEPSTDLQKNGSSENTEVREIRKSANPEVPKNGSSKNRKENTNRLNDELIDLKKNKDIRKIVPPLLDWVIDYAKSRNSQSSPEYFFDHYEMNGWVQNSGVKIKDWQAAFRNWERNDKRGFFNKPIPSNNTRTPDDNPIPYKERYLFK